MAAPDTSLNFVYRSYVDKSFPPLDAMTGDALSWIGVTQETFDKFFDDFCEAVGFDYMNPSIIIQDTDICPEKFYDDYAEILWMRKLEAVQWKRSARDLQRNTFHRYKGFHNYVLALAARSKVLKAVRGAREKRDIELFGPVEVKEVEVMKEVEEVETMEKVKARVKELEEKEAAFLKREAGYLGELKDLKKQLEQCSISKQAKRRSTL